MHGQPRHPIQRIYKHVMRVLLAYLLIPIGFLFEFAITFPHMIMVTIDNYRQKDSGVDGANLRRPGARGRLR